MSSKRSVGRAAYWRSVFERHADSGLSIRRFCQENGISQSTFFARRKKLNKEPVGVKSTSPAARRDDSQAASPGTSFVAVKLPVVSESTESAPIEVVHPLGYVVRVGSGANLDCLPQIFQILDQHTAK